MFDLGAHNGIVIVDKIMCVLIQDGRPILHMSDGRELAPTSEQAGRILGSLKASGFVQVNDKTYLNCNRVVHFFTDAINNLMIGTDLETYPFFRVEVTYKSEALRALHAHFSG